MRHDRTINQNKAKSIGSYYVSNTIEHKKPFSVPGRVMSDGYKQEVLGFITHLFSVIKISGDELLTSL